MKRSAFMTLRILAAGLACLGIGLAQDNSGVKAFVGARVIDRRLQRLPPVAPPDPQHHPRRKPPDGAGHLQPAPGLRNCLRRLPQHG